MTLADKALLLSLLVLIGALFSALWGTTGQAAQVAISGPQGRTVYSLNENQQLRIAGRLGPSHIEIQDKAVRFVSSPCPHKVCQRSGWHRQAGGVAACVPNRISLVLLGSSQAGEGLDAISY